jgi:hypothetical protein
MALGGLPNILTQGMLQAPGFGEDDWRKVIEAAEAHAVSTKAETDDLIRQFKDGILRTSEGGEVSANFAFSYITMLMAFLMGGGAPSPEIEARDVDGGGGEVFMPLVQMGMFPNPDEARRQFADAIEQEQGYAYENAGSEYHNLAALFYGLVQGQGIIKLSYDVERGLDRADALWNSEFYADPNARYCLPQAQYVVQTCVWPLEQARKFFEARGVPKIEPNYKLGQGEGLAEAKQAKDSPEGALKDLYKFHEVWAKEGDQRVLMYFEGISKKLLAPKGPWPFRLDRDEFPFSQLCFNRQYLKLTDGFSDLQVTKGLQRSYEASVTFIDKHTKRSRAKKVMADKGMIDDDQMNLLEDPDDMKFIPVKVPAGKQLTDCVRVIDFNSGNDADMEVASGLKSIIDEIWGQDELLRGADAGGKEMTAREAMVRDANSKLRTGRRQKILDGFLADQTRKRVMIALQLVAPEKLARIAGPQAALLWSLHGADPEDITAEYSIGVTAGSTSEMHKQERLERMGKFYERAKEANQLYNATIYNLIEIETAISKIDGIRRPEQYQNPQAVAAIEQNGGAPIPMGPPPGAPMPRGPGPGPKGPPQGPPGGGLPA